MNPAGRKLLQLKILLNASNTKDSLQLKKQKLQLYFQPTKSILVFGVSTANPIEFRHNKWLAILEGVAMIKIEI
jgi:hypothetical protein